MRKHKDNYSDIRAILFSVRCMYVFISNAVDYKIYIEGLVSFVTLKEHTLGNIGAEEIEINGRI